MTKKKQKKTGKNTILESAYRIVRRVLDLIAGGYMVLILLVMPLYHQEGFIHIGTDKSTFLRLCSRNVAKVLIPVWLLYLALGAVIRRKEKSRMRAGIKSLHLSVTEGFALLYGVGVLLSYACSNYQETVWFGEGGWYMGTVTQLVLLGSYFMVSRLWERRDWLIALILPVSAAVFALGLLNRFNIYPIDMRAQNAQFISTIGNINWYCGYMMSVLFGGFALLWQSERLKVWQRALLGLYVASGFASLVTQGSSSGVFTLAVMLVMTFCFSASDGKRMRMFWVETLTLSLVCLAVRLVRRAGWGELNYVETATEFLTNSALPIVMTSVSVLALLWVVYMEKKGHYPQKLFQILAAVTGVGTVSAFVIFAVLIAVNTISGGAVTADAGEGLSSVLTFSPTWGSNRGATWWAGLRVFWEQDLLHKLVGVGADGMAAFLYTDGSSGLIEMVKGCFYEDRLTNAHNEWITVLANTGILGFVGYVGMMTTAAVRFLRQRGKDAVVTACGFCLTAYTVNNMFSFQQAMNASTIFILLGVGENYLRKRQIEGKA